MYSSLLIVIIKWISSITYLLPHSYNMSIIYYYSGCHLFIFLSYATRHPWAPGVYQCMRDQCKYSIQHPCWILYMHWSHMHWKTPGAHGDIPCHKIIMGKKLLVVVIVLIYIVGTSNFLHIILWQGRSHGLDKHWFHIISKYCGWDCIIIIIITNTILPTKCPMILLPRQSTFFIDLQCLIYSLYFSSSSIWLQ